MLLLKNREKFNALRGFSLIFTGPRGPPPGERKKESEHMPLLEWGRGPPAEQKAVGRETLSEVSIPEPQRELIGSQALRQGRRPGPEVQRKAITFEFSLLHIYQEPKHTVRLFSASFSLLISENFYVIVTQENLAYGFPQIGAIAPILINCTSFFQHSV